MKDLNANLENTYLDLDNVFSAVQYWKSANSVSTVCQTVKLLVSALKMTCGSIPGQDGQAFLWLTLSNAGTTSLLSYILGQLK